MILAFMEDLYTRLIHDRRTHIGQKQRNELGLLSVKDRVTQLKLNQVFKIYHGISPDYLQTNFIRITSLHNYSTRGSPHNFIVPRIQGQANLTFFYSGHTALEFLAQFHQANK